MSTRLRRAQPVPASSTDCVEVSTKETAFILCPQVCCSTSTRMKERGRCDTMAHRVKERCRAVGLPATLLVFVVIVATTVVATVSIEAVIDFAVTHNEGWESPLLVKCGHNLCRGVGHTGIVGGHDVGCLVDEGALLACRVRATSVQEPQNAKRADTGTSCALLACHIRASLVQERQHTCGARAGTSGALLACGSNAHSVQKL